MQLDKSNHHSQDQYELVSFLHEHPSELVMAEVIRKARQVWTHVYGDVRISGKGRTQRWDVGTKRNCTADSEASFIKRRRTSVGAFAKSNEGNRQESIDALADETLTFESGWTVTHDKEEAFIKAKRARRLLETVKEGGALPSDVDNEMLATLVEMSVKDAKAKQAHKSKAKRAQEFRDGPVAKTTTDAAVHFEQRVDSTGAWWRQF